MIQKSTRPSCPLHLATALPQLTELMHEVSELQLRFFQTDLAIQQKQDHTPVTLADQQSSELICAQLQQLSSWPVLSEESAHPSWSERQHWQTYWLVDPLDGTREFIAGRAEFTINIALIQSGWPVFGLIWSAATGKGWWGALGHGAYAISENKPPQAMATQPPPSSLTDWVVLSSHHSKVTATSWHCALQTCRVEFLGSSLKFCRIASGQAHLYWRAGPTGEWDTAAGQAIVEAAGGLVIDLEHQQPLRYNQKESLINPSFVVASGRDTRWQDLLKS